MSGHRIRFCMSISSILHDPRTEVFQEHQVRHTCFAIRFFCSLTHLVFRNNRFYIDELHAHGHTTCSSACLIAPVMQRDSVLHQVNTSAAEGAHAFISRIEKSLSYMNEQHAILSMWIMINVWNRKKLKKFLLEGNGMSAWLQ